MIKRVDKRLQAVQCLTGNKIKIIACITMLIDHFSKIFLESIMNDKLFPLYLAGGMSTEQFYGIDAFQKNILNGIGTIAFPLRSQTTMSISGRANRRSCSMRLSFRSAT